MGGELIVQMNEGKDVLSVSGEVLPDIKVDTSPMIGQGTAQQNALESIAKDYGISVGDLTASNPELWVYNPALLGGSGVRMNSLVWRIEVTDINMLTLKELVLVDAHLGVVALHFSEVDTAKSRQIYDNQNNPANLLPGPNLVRSEGQPAINDPDVDKAYDYGGDTYDFYWTNHSRDSLDAAGMALVSTVRYCSTNPLSDCPYPNAFWNGAQMVYGEGYASAADVVGHEMTHGVTDHESRLFYFMQSGAINESLSDIWGEFIDRTYVNPNDNWLMGEALAGGAIRSMSDPTLFYQPDKMSSSNYFCGSWSGADDNGGVHTNSGVGNKAAYLMVAGGVFNGKTITPLPGGMPEVAKIYYEVQTHMLTSAGDYADLYTDLRQACTNLIGSGVTTAADCQQVRNALDAVEMDAQPTYCPATEAPLCIEGQVPVNIFFDNLENPALGNWTHAAIIGNDEWYYPQNSHSYSFDATYATSGENNFWGYDVEVMSDYYIALTKNIALLGGTTPYLHFNHAFAFEEPYYDGGVVEYSTDSGATWSDAGSLMDNNGYTGYISDIADNPLGGRQGFVGYSNGYISSRLNLVSLVGKNVRFRFRIGTDSGTDGFGWFLDDIRAYTCAAPQTPTVTPIGKRIVSLPLVLRGKPSLTPSPTTQPTPTSRPSLPGTLNAAGDACVAQGQAGSNYGDTTDMLAGYDEYYSPNMQTVRGLIQFDLSAIPAGTLINNAILNIYYQGYWDYPDHSRTITSYRINTSWTEMGVTWNNQPSVAEAFGTVNIAANNSWGYVTLNVTNLVQGWVNGTYANYGIMLRGPEVSGTDSSWREFGTRESGSGPQLVITYAGVNADTGDQTNQQISPENNNPISITNGPNSCQDVLTLIKCFIHR
jgi:hypothetical protein